MLDYASYTIHSSNLSKQVLYVDWLFSVTDFKSDVTVPVEDNMDELAGQESRVIDGYTKIESKTFCLHVNKSHPAMHL